MTFRTEYFFFPAEAGYKALFVSVDLPILGNRLNEIRNNFSFPTHLNFPNLSDDVNEFGLKNTYEMGYGAL